VAAQIAAAVTSDRDGGFEVRLSPEELGTVKLALLVSEGSVTLAIEAERPETMELIRRSMDILEREFRDAGFTSLNLSFGQGGRERQAREAAAYSATLHDRSSEAAAVAQHSAPHGRATSSTQLDLRL
jgi:flagellar hook-length control protein FliK